MTAGFDLLRRPSVRSSSGELKGILRVRVCITSSELPANVEVYHPNTLRLCYRSMIGELRHDRQPDGESGTSPGTVVTFHPATVCRNGFGYQRQSDAGARTFTSPDGDKPLEDALTIPW